MLLSSSDNTDAYYFVYKFCPERTGFYMYAEYKQPKLPFLALVPWVVFTQVSSVFMSLKVQVLTITPP